MSNNNVAILSIMSKFDEKSAKDAAKRANKVYDEELSNLGNVNFDEKLLKNFDKAMNLLKGKFKKVNLSSYTNNLLDSIFSDKDIKEKSTDINSFIKKIDLLKKASSGQDINAFNTFSAKQIDALIGRTEKLAKKQKEINEKAREYNREATKIAKPNRTVSTIDKKYGSQDYSKTLDLLKKTLTTEKDFTKEENESIENLAKMVQLYQTMEKSEPQKGTAENIRYSKDLLTVTQKIKEEREKIDSFTRKGATKFIDENELGSINKVSDYTIIKSKEDFIKENLNILKTQEIKLQSDLTTYISNSVQRNLQKVTSEVNYVVDKAEKCVEGLQNKIDTLKGGFSENSDDQLIKNIVDETNIKTLEEIEDRLYTIYDKDLEGEATNKELKEYIQLYKQYSDLVSKDDTVKFDPSLKEEYEFILQQSDLLKRYSEQLDNVINKNKEINTEVKNTNKSIKDQNNSVDSYNNLESDLKEIKNAISGINEKIDSINNSDSFENIGTQLDNLDERVSSVSGHVDKLIDSINLLSSLSLSDIQKTTLPLYNGINELFKANNGNRISGYWEDLKKEVEGSNVQLRELLKNVGLFDSKNNQLKLISDGMENSGGIIGDDKVLIARKNHGKNFEEKTLLKQKLDEAYKAGVNVSRILDIIGSKESDVFFDIQEKAHGNILGNIYGQGEDFVNTDWLEATDEQINKFVSDLVKLQEMGINVESNLTNIMYDKKNGFSFIDMDLDTTKFDNNAELLQDHMMRIFGDLEDFYLDNNDATNANIVSKARKRFESLSKQVQQAYAEAQDSHSPSKDFQQLENDAVDGIVIGANENEGKLKNIGKQMAENVKEGFKEGIKNISLDELNISSDTSLQSKISNSVTDQIIANNKKKYDDTKNEWFDLNSAIKIIKDKSSYKELSYGFDGFHEEVQKITSAIVNMNEEGQESTIDYMIQVQKLLNLYEMYRKEAEIPKNMSQAKKFESFLKNEQLNAYLNPELDTDSNIFKGFLNVIDQFIDVTTNKFIPLETRVQEIISEFGQISTITSSTPASESNISSENISKVNSELSQEEKKIKDIISLFTNMITISKKGTDGTLFGETGKAFNLSNMFKTEDFLSDFRGMLNIVDDEYDKLLSEISKKSLDTFAHTHPNGVASFSPNDLSSAFILSNDTNNAISKQIIATENEISFLDIGKIKTALNSVDLENKFVEEFEKATNVAADSLNGKELQYKIKEILINLLDKYGIDSDTTYKSASLSDFANAYINNSIDELSPARKSVSDFNSVLNSYDWINNVAKEDLNGISNLINEYEKIKSSISSLLTQWQNGVLNDTEEIDELSKIRNRIENKLKDLGFGNNEEKLRGFSFDQAKQEFEGIQLQAGKTAQAIKEVTSTASTDQKKDAFPGSSTNTKPETEGMEQVEKATEEAVQAKKEFATANEGVQSSIDGSENPLKLEAELMEQIAKSAREAADAKKEFVEANKQVKESADESNSANKRKDRYANAKKVSSDEFLDRYDEFLAVGNKTASQKGGTILGNSVNISYDVENELVKVSAKIKDVDGTWRSFSAKLSSDLQVFPTGFKTITKGVNNLDNELANFGKDKIKIPETDEQVQKFKELNTVIDDYASVRERMANDKAFDNDEEDSQKLLKTINEIMGKADGSATILSSKQLSDAQDKLDKIDKTISDIQQKNAQKVNNSLLKIQNDATEELSKYTNSSKYTPEFIGRVNSKITEISKLKITEPEDVSRLKTIDNEVQKIVNDSKLLENKLVKQDSKIADIISHMKIFASQNTNMSSSQKQLLNEMTTQAERLEQAGKTTGKEVDDLRVSFAHLKADVASAGNMGKNFFSQIGSRLTDMNSKFVAQFLSWQDWIRYLQQGFDTVRELDTAMTEVKKVSNATEAQYASFRNTISSTAKEIATTNKELLNSSADFLRLGYSLDQASDLAKNATLFVNVGDGVDITEATEDMITVMKAFDIQAEDSIKIVDDYNQIGNQFALSATDIGEAMKRSASALETGNNSFEESIALITAMNEIVQNSENTGNTLKVFSLRLRGAKAELEDMGEDTDGLCESTSKLREQLKSLTGIDIMLNDNTFKSTTQIVKELGATWDKLSDSSQAATLELVAGKTRANNVAALLKNYQKIDEVMESLGDAEGSALRENEAIVDSIDGRIKVLSATAEDFWQKFIDTDLVKDTISSLSGILNLLTKIIDKVGLLPPLSMGVGLVQSLKGHGKIVLRPSL